MVKIILKMPRDLSFLSNILYEGLLFSTKFSKAKYNGVNLELPDDFIITTLKNLSEDEINNLRIKMSGNDNANRKLFEILGIKDQSKKTYYDFLMKIKRYAEHFKLQKDTIEFGINFKRKDMLIDGKELSAPQLFKVDRYTGISSLESRYTSQQITIYASKEILLLFIFGLYSSFVASVRHQNQQYYFFLTFSPEEIEEILKNVEDKEFIKKLFRTKKGVIQILSEVLNKTTLNEILLLEIYLNAELRRLLEKENLDKISTVLFKIAPEGQTYKVYELIPITIYRESQEFYETIKKFFKDPEKFLESLTETLRPDGIIFDALRNINKYNEANNVLKAIYGLYRFIVIGDANGWYEFIREINNAHRKLESSTKAKEKKRCKLYKQLLQSYLY